jgi:hypothetical protein
MSNSTLNMKNETSVVTVPSRSSLRFAPVLVIAALMAFCSTLTRADTIAFSISVGQILENSRGDVTFGYAFTVSSPIMVTNLGLFDSNNDGLVTSHAVTIWTSTGTQLVQGTIPAGTGGTLINGFRYVSIAPFSLPAGTYTIGGFYGALSDVLAFQNNSITPASGLSYVGGRSEDEFTFPSGDLFHQARSYFGPNFQFTTGVATPDSGSTVSPLGCALLGLAVLRRKLRC